MQARGAAGGRNFWCCVEKGFKIRGVKRIFLGKEASAHGRSYTRCARDGEARATAWSKGGVRWGVGRDDVIYKRNNCDKNRKRNLFGFIARIFLTFSAHKKFSAAIGPRSALTRWAYVRRSVSCGLDVPKLTPWRERTASCFRPLLHTGDDRTPPSLSTTRPRAMHSHHVRALLRAGERGKAPQKCVFSMCSCPPLSRPVCPCLKIRGTRVLIIKQG